MATGVAQMVVQGFFEGSISLTDKEIERRPYHKNCGCALHSMKSTICSNACPKQTCISFPKKSWKECSMSKTASIFPSQSSLPKTRQCHTDNQGRFHHREQSHESWKNFWEDLKKKRLERAEELFCLLLLYSTVTSRRSPS